MSLPAPVEKIAEAAGPASGAITPFRRSPERDATAPEEFLGASAPKSFATAPRLIAGAPSGTAATSAGATNTHVQCASWKASNNTMAATASVPKMPLFTAAGGWGAVAIWKLEHALVPGLALEVDVEVEPRLEAERMLLVVEEPGLKHDVLRLVGLHHPRHVDHDQLHHALVEGVSLRAVRHELRALIERVVLGKVEHGVVGLPDGALPQELQEVFPVGIVGDPAVAERLHLAELRLLPQLRQLLGFREGHVGRVRDLVGRHGEAHLLQVGRELAAGHGELRELLGERADVVVLAVEEREPARLRLVDHVDLDAPHEGQALATQVGRDLPRRLVVAAGALEELLAVAGIRFEDDARASEPLPDEERAGAHRVRMEVLAVELAHLARDRRGGRHGEHEGKAVVGVVELDPQRVAVERAQSRDRAVVVEAFGLLRLGHQGVGALDLAFDQEEPLASQLRIEEALDRVDEVAVGELAPL